jgi:hypothetical protein
MLLTDFLVQIGLEGKFRSLGAHLADSHIFSFIFYDHFFEQILFLGLAFFSRFNCLLLLIVEVIQVDLVVIFVFKSM